MENEPRSEQNDTQWVKRDITVDRIVFKILQSVAKLKVNLRVLQTPIDQVALVVATLVFRHNNLLRYYCSHFTGGRSLGEVNNLPK